MVLTIIGIAGVLLAVLGLGSVCVAVQRTHEAIHSRNREIWAQVDANLERGAKLFMPFDIWSSR